MRVYYTADTGEITHVITTGNSSILARQTDPYIEAVTLPGDLRGLRVQDGALVVLDLGPDKASAGEEIDEVVGEARLSLITALPGQDLIYLHKEEEAKAYLASNPAPADLTDYPLMAAEVGITASTAYELAQLWINMSAQWINAAAAIEGTRLTCKDQVANATTVSEIQQAVSALKSTLAGYGL